MRLCASVPNALRHRVGLGPYDVLTKEPAIGLQGECDAPGNADQVLRFDDALWFYAARFQSLP
jgi:hypothetical protein